MFTSRQGRNQSRWNSQQNLSTSSYDDDDVNTKPIKRKSSKSKDGQRKNYLKINKPAIYIFIGTSFFLFLLLVIDIKLKLDTRNDSKEREVKSVTQTETLKCKKSTYCPDVLTHAVSGHWLRQSTALYTPWKQYSIEKIREKLGLPKNMSRDDLHCGIHFPIPQTRLAALCSTKSEENYRCCESTGFCGKTTDNCQNTTSFNMLDMISEDRAVWVPKNTKCNLKEFNSNEACTILSKAVKKLVFLGDSQARNFFASLVMLLTGDYHMGAIDKKYKNNDFVKENCTSSFQILNFDCRKFLVKSTRDIDNICSGHKSSFEIEYVANYDSFVSKKTAQLYESLYDQKDTYILVGAGTHFNSDHLSFIGYFFGYMVQQKKKRKWPRDIVETLHEVYSPTSTSKRNQFNNMVARKAKELAVDVFDNTELSRLLESYDGRNFGMKFQMMKVNILLHYFHNLMTC